ncbi:c-type cytochrome [Simiduia agarivorans]|uniref:Cytochrome c family protein n=1 Tax=Simiduia agarivorans (strain DSM 21679 / JCM 13881 / BCRC 17597 / SA1) TaxID=1117647 RepID=K4KIJ7_SIMAS|nr:cytochrome c [Simiduia agarivorans]AFU97788.1 cytochrome c family protein [Simiduia agarivorans SA1 = DSM 21679]
MPTPTAFLKSFLIIVVTTLIGGGLFIYSGSYPMGADVPHNQLTYWLLETLRERSIERSATDIQIPGDLNTSDRLLAGGADYNDMCAGCHLKPGKESSDFTLGLYPVPPNLTITESLHPRQQAADQADDEYASAAAIKRQFWIIKHGIKASGMPAWGPTHDDQRIWNMVAFLQRLPSLSAQQYQILTARSDDQSHHH